MYLKTSCVWSTQTNLLWLFCYSVFYLHMQLSYKNWTKKFNLWGIFSTWFFFFCLYFVYSSSDLKMLLKVLSPLYKFNKLYCKPTYICILWTFAQRALCKFLYHLGFLFFFVHFELSPVDLTLSTGSLICSF